MSTPITAPADALHRAATRKAMLRLIPLMCLIYLLSYLDRTNVSIAKSQLAIDLGLSAAAYGFGAGIFFLSYALLEVPSNLAAHRFGPRRWIVRIAITWGALSAAMMFVQGESSFYVMRMLLGAAEAGLFPALMYMVTLWFAQEDRSIAVGWVYTAPAMALLIGNPVGGALMQLDGNLGLHGWQWMFLAEGVPSILVGVLLWFKLPERPHDARWLSKQEADALTARAVGSNGGDAHAGKITLAMLKQALLKPFVTLIGLIYFFNQIAFIGLIFFTPAIVQQMHVKTPFLVGALSSAIGVGSVIGVLGVPRIQRRLQRDCLLLGLLTFGLIAGSVLFLLVPTLLVRIALLAILAFFGKGVLTLYWTIAMGRMHGFGAAAGLAFINMLGLIGAFVGPYAYGLAESATGNASSGFFVAILASLLGLALVPLLPAALRRADAEAKALQSQATPVRGMTADSPLV
ncbi:MFS transporter [Burkholderia sp. SRS-W-2-2016]|uniref:MFS transporter n=1 Tax=Burkholderia sp. SRS-W-2-2016 TaxID=1926878 RepID=UPI00094AB6CC|nr:MFS transporter [Burkholderia sp. SRS-W-2-2016]OLL33270.1 MFS transporter [Burkholderia sp. SRS-W-2-2016]